MAKIERTKNASRNIFFGIILRVYQIIVPFLMRTAMIYLMGVQYLGLNSLFTSILQVLNLVELGVGTAMVYSMYKPIAEDDCATICALMKLYKIYYRVIGSIIAVIGLLLTPFIPNLISGGVPNDVNVYIIYLLNLAATVLSYWLYAYKNSIFQAHQRTDIISKVSLVTNTIQYLIQIFVLWFYKNYYLFLITSLVTQAITNIIIAILADKLYPNYKPIGNISEEKVKEINRRICDLFTSKVGGVVYDSADTVVISSFLGLTFLAIYQNYFYILNAISSFIIVIFSACLAGIGNSVVVESKEKNYSDLKKLTFIICWITGICSNCLLCLYQPFMELWVGKDLMLPFSAVICFVIYFFVRQLNGLFNLYKDASGIWHEDKYRPLIAATTNLLLNLILVQYMGVYGIVLSTVIAILFVGMPWLIHNLFTTIFDKKYLKEFLMKLCVYCIVVVCSAYVCYLVCSLIELELFTTVIIRGVLCLIITNIMFIIIYRKTDEYQFTLKMLNNITNGRISMFLKKVGMD